MIVLLGGQVCAACAGIARNDAKAVGSAGQTAAQALVDQDRAAATKLTSIPQWYAVREDLQCVVRPAAQQDACLALVRNPPSPVAADLAKRDKAVAVLAQIMQKRAQAAQALETAYAAFVDLATYDAGAATTAAIKTAATSIDNLSKTIGTLIPTAAPAELITPAVTSLLADVGGLVAAERQSQMLLKASKALHVACEALAKDLGAERDFTTSTLLGVLQTEAGTTYQAFLAAGLVTAPQILSPVLQSVAPGTALGANPPAENAKVIRQAAVDYLSKSGPAQAQQVQQTYDKAVAALVALAAQHEKLESGASLDVADILARVQSLEADLQQLNPKPPSAPAPANKASS